MEGGERRKERGEKEKKGEGRGEEERRGEERREERKEHDSITRSLRVIFPLLHFLSGCVWSFLEDWIPNHALVILDPLYELTKPTFIFESREQFLKSHSSPSPILELSEGSLYSP